jgi:hypothetical protein
MNAGVSLLSLSLLLLVAGCHGGDGQGEGEGEGVEGEGEGAEGEGEGAEGEGEGAEGEGEGEDVNGIDVLRHHVASCPQRGVGAGNVRVVNAADVADDFAAGDLGVDDVLVVRGVLVTVPPVQAVLADASPTTNPDDVPVIVLDTAALARVTAHEGESLIVQAKELFVFDDEAGCVVDVFGASRVAPAALEAVLAAKAAGGVLPSVLVSPSRPLCVLQGEQSDVFAVHRLSARYEADFVGDLAGPDLEVTWHITAADDDGLIATRTLSPDGGAAHDAGRFTDAYDDGDRVLTFELNTVGAGFTFVGGTPVFGTSAAVKAVWDTPVIGAIVDGAAQTRREDRSFLIDCTLDDGPAAGEAEGVWAPAVDGPVGVSMTVFHDAIPNNVSVIIKTLWLRRFGSTTLTGLTPAPLSISTPFALTYLPLHHNFGANVVIEPRKDPSLSDDNRTALIDADVAAVVFKAYDFDLADDELYVIGRDGSVRTP